MKRSVLAVFLLISLIGLVAAEGIADILSAFDPSTVILSSIFIIEFSVLFFALQKGLKGNNTIAAVIAGVISFFTIYFVNKSGFDFSGLLLTWGISPDWVMTIFPIIIVAGIIFAIVKLKSGSLFVFGGLLLVFSMFAYAQTLLMIIAIILILLGLILTFKKKRNPLMNPPSGNTVNTHNVYNEKNVHNIKNEERKIEQQDQQIIQQGRKEEAKKAQQSAEEIKRLFDETNSELKNLINEYNRVQREDPNNRDYMIQLKNRILQLRDELKRLRSG